MGQEGYGTAMNNAEDLTDGDSLTEAVKKYVERATQAEERMAQMEAKFEERLPLCPCRNFLIRHTTITPPPHAACLTQQQQPPPHNPQTTINIPALQIHQQQQAYQPTANKRARRGKAPRSATGGNT